MPSAGRESTLATSPLPSRGPKRGRECYITPAFSGAPNAIRRERIKSGYLSSIFSTTRSATRAFPGVPDPHPKVPQIERKSEMGTSPLPSQDPKKRSKMLRNPQIVRYRGRQARGENQKWLPHPGFLEGPKEVRMATQPFAFLGVPNARRGEKIRIGYLAATLSRAQKRVEVLRSPCILRGSP